MSCRSCGAPLLAEVLDLGAMPLANALPARADADEERFPLVLAICPACALLQITHTVPPERLFRDYVYFSSYSDTMVAHARELAARMIVERGLGAGSTVVEIASNDGYLLRHYRERGVRVLGIEPAANIARVARDEHGIPTLAEFFGRELAARLDVRADVLHAHNVLAHVADLDGVVAGMAAILAPEGVAVVEVPYARDMIEGRAFDTIYHEHLCYFSVTALAPLFARHGLVIGGVERVPIHGGSLRLFLSRGASRAQVAAFLEEERALGMDQPGYYRGFAGAVRALRDDLVTVVRGLRDQGRRVAAYGAAAKGAVLLNYCGLGPGSIEYVVDRSPHKQGRFMPGVKIPIVAPAHLAEQRPDVLLILPWNVAPEIMAQQAELHRLGTRFLLPVPEVKVL